MRSTAALSVFLKGAGIGAANIIPGVSGGTIALVTGIYPRLIEALRNASRPETIRQLIRGEWQRTWRETDATFLAWLAVGVATSILLFARIFEYLLRTQEVPTMAFFFGLVLISIYHVGRTIERWDPPRILIFVFGTAVASALAFVAPAEANPNHLYLVLCGIVAICSMVLPGLSGSFVLILMGNYVLVLRGLNQMDFGIIVPFSVGCAIGLLGFVQVLGWALKKAQDTVIALMSGFVAGSLLTIWPWKQTATRIVELEGEPHVIASGFEWHLPSEFDAQFWIAIAAMIIGGLFLHLVTTRSADAPPTPES